MDFNDFALDERVLEGINAMNYKQATPIQSLAIPLILEGRDVVACAQTGTGKTAAYLLPILHRIVTSRDHNTLNTLVLVPTRELALQIDQQLSGFSYFLPVSSLPVYGGGEGSVWDQQKSGIIQGADMIIATPGRLIQHMNLGYLDLSKLQHLVLDEADRMLDMGFYDDIMRIIRRCPEDRQTLLFSATMPPRIRKLAGEILRRPEFINIAISKPAAGITQEAYVVYDSQKIALAEEIINGDYPSVIVFASTKRSVKDLDETLRRKKFNVAAIHSDLEQADREKVLLAFRNRSIQVLVATDVLSRGIDIENISLVINFDVPVDAEDYVHRVGRTARAAATGKAITFINEKEQRKFSRIEQLIGYEVNKMPIPAHIGEGPVYDPNKKHARTDGNNRRSGKPSGQRTGRTKSGSPDANGQSQTGGGQNQKRVFRKKGGGNGANGTAGKEG